MRPGHAFGDLVIEARLGAGGMGTVFRVAHAATGARYALKVLSAFAGADDVRRFAREGEALARVDDHPHVVRVHAAGERDGRRYLLMQLCTGGDLRSRLKGGGLPFDEAARLVADVARGVAHVHAHGVVHRDLKPENVLFDDAGRARVSDFGLARVADAESLTATGTLLGTPAYMAPEQADGQPADARSDVWGLGGLLIAALTGRPPYSGTSPLAVISRLLREDPRWPSADRPDTPPALEAIARRAMARSPDDRYADAATVADDLERYLRGEASAPRRRRGRIAASVGVVGVVGAVAVLLAAAAWRPAASTVAIAPPVATERPDDRTTTSPSSSEPAAPRAPRWREAPAGQARRLTTPTTPRHLIFLDGSRLLVGHDAGVSLVDVETEETLAEWRGAFVQGMLVAGGRLLVARHEDGEALIHSLDPDTLDEAPGSTRTFAERNGVASLAGSDDGGVLAVGIVRGGARVIESSGEFVVPFEGLPRELTLVAVRADGDVVACGTASEVHVVRREEGGWGAPELVAGLPGKARTLRFHSSGDVFVGVASGWFARVEVETRSVTAFGASTIGGPLAHDTSYGVRDLSWVDEGLLLSAASDIDDHDPANGRSELCAWDMATREQRWKLPHPGRGTLWAAAVSRDGQRLALGYNVPGAAGAAGLVQVWEHP